MIGQTGIIGKKLIEIGWIIRKDFHPLTDCGWMESDDRLFDFASLQPAEVASEMAS